MTDFLDQCRTAMLDFLCTLAAKPDGAPAQAATRQLVPPLVLAARRCANTTFPPAYA